MAKQKTYIAIDLKSFYASVECKERNRDPLTTNLVVADKSRTEKTICLAVSPSLKSYGIPGRPRLFEVVQKVKEANNTRRWKALNRTFTGSSDDSTELNANPALEIDYIVAPPRMAYYLEYSTKIYSVYLKYIAPEDIFPYSIDEVFIDATNYLNTYQMTARELAMTMIQDVLKTTGITATAGIGTNMYLCKIAMDIVAKHIEPDKDGVRIAELDEMSYRSYGIIDRLQISGELVKAMQRNWKNMDFLLWEILQGVPSESRMNCITKNCSTSCLESMRNC